MTRLSEILARRWFGVILFVTFFLWWALLTKVYTHSWQEESRMATIQTLVEQGTFVIDHTEFNRTGDKVFINEHFYSDKTPLLSVAAAGCSGGSGSGQGMLIDPGPAPSNGLQIVLPVLEHAIALLKEKPDSESGHDALSHRANT